ncbi:hypothetical protein ACFS5M_10990 [Lacinutrix iliipiscaria]|uniref:Uncharacterized protein n=1 Tax=Lacinutrix iliipiscaria TaxID=1230532 RepID=A0ABW5WQF2_9FLAO
MRHIICTIILMTLFGCNSNKEEQTKDDSKIVYDMYEPSEMSLLMNEMYDYNLKIKEEILAGEIPKEFPLDFLKIHTAELSEFKSRNETFKSFSTLFINAEREVFKPNDSISIESRFNNAVGVCISCHQTECTGPIPRIKKLLIQ